MALKGSMNGIGGTFLAPEKQEPECPQVRNGDNSTVKLGDRHRCFVSS